MMLDARQFSEACFRNQQPIGDVLESLIPSGPCRVVEIGSGTGQHAIYFAQRFPQLTWQPTDQVSNHPSIEAWRTFAALPQVLPVSSFNLFDAVGDLAPADIIIAINVLHIAPESASERLFAHAQHSLSSRGRLIIYGPFRYPDHPLEASNLSFEAYLQQQDPARGIRHVEHLDSYAAKHGFAFEGDASLPANNHLRWWRKSN